MKQILVASVMGFVGMSYAQTEGNWPPLPKEKFVSGRIATQSDYRSGRAVFFVEGNGASDRKPASIVIPQYAYAINGQKKTPVVIVQAEYVRSEVMLGARTENGTEQILMLNEVELLGLQTPSGKNVQPGVQADVP